MNTKTLMIASALVMGLIGAGLTFMPAEFLDYIDVNATGATSAAIPSHLLKLVAQTLGAAYLGFAFLNWMAKGTVVGGIYNRPIALGNLLHFLMVSITLIKLAAAMQTGSQEVMWVITSIYSALTLGFVWVVFGRPKID
jgi:hypothetical protein